MFCQDLRSELLAASFVVHRRNLWRRVGVFTTGFRGMGTYYDQPTTQKVAGNCLVSGIQRPLGRQLRSIADCLKLTGRGQPAVLKDSIRLYILPTHNSEPI